MSDTPETDEELAFRGFGFYTMGGLPADAVKVEFARKLERERDAVEQRLFDVRDVLLDAMPDANAPTKILAEMIVAERDSDQRQADALLDRLGATQERMIDAERERDEWKEVAESNLLGAFKERNEAVRACEIWQYGVGKIVEDRDELLNTVRVLRDDADVIVADRDYWRAEAERWRGLSQESVDEVAFDDQTAPYGEWWEAQK